MKTDWDTLIWEVEAVPEGNEIRVHIEGRVRHLDDQMYHKMENNPVDINKITLKPEEKPSPK